MKKYKIFKRNLQTFVATQKRLPSPETSRCFLSTNRTITGYLQAVTVTFKMDPLGDSRSLLCGSEKEWNKKIYV